MKSWEDFLLRLEGELGADTVRKWLRTLQVVRFDACNLYLEAKDSFQALWFEEHIRQKVISGFYNNNHKKIRVHLSIANRNGSPAKKKTTSQPASPPAFQLSFDPLDPYCTFEHFVREEDNAIPIKILEEETNQFNPLFLCGPGGSGKTHLLMATTAMLREKGLKVIYARAETFTEHVVSAIRSSEMQNFRLAYRNADVLILDNVQTLSKKSATQEELFHTFNTLHMSGKQLILAANCFPKDLSEIEARLVSRFEWGIVLPLKPVHDRQKLLEKKAAALHYPLSQKLIEFLLESFPSSPKALIRALEALILRSHVNKSEMHALFRPMTVQLAKHYLADLLLTESQAALTPQKIIQHCSEHYGIRPDDILGKAQTRECTEPRQVAMYLCRKELKLPFTKIGTIFGRDHSTVMSSVKQMEKLIADKDSRPLSILAEIEKKGWIK